MARAHPRLERIISLFMNQESSGPYQNTYSNGLSLALHGNSIAKWVICSKGKIPELWITTADWDTPTTRKRLNLLPGVYVFHRRGQLMLRLNGGPVVPWDGKWLYVDGQEEQEEKEEVKKTTSFKKAFQVAQSRAGKE